MKQYEMEKLLKEIISECRAIKLPVSNNIAPEVLINKRAKSRFGACKKEGTGFRIEICRHVLDADEAHVRNILAHEVLHTCKGCYNHGVRWKEYAARMNEAYGYNISTTTSYESLGLDRPAKKKTVRYMVVCQSCGRKIYRQKKSKLITHTKQYRCTCGGKLKSYIIEQE